jgi:electron transport complex protein RnfG
MTASAKPKPPLTGAEVARIIASMAGTCAVGAVILGAVYVGTERYAEAARLSGERRAVTELLSLDADGAGTVVREVRQFLGNGGREVVYREVAADGAPGREVVFTLDGELVRQGAAPAPVEGETPKGLHPLGRVFVASKGGRDAGFVVEGEIQGYKNRIRFFVALDSAFDVAGVRVLEHEEDPGLGAEVATPWFQGQYLGRPVSSLATLDVTRDPMPEDWRGALMTLDRTPAADWRARNGGLVTRERDRPIYAVTGATISSRALTDGVRTTADHFRRRWQLVAPHLGGTS